MASPSVPFLYSGSPSVAVNEGFIEEENTDNQLILRDVVAYVEVRSKAENRSKAVAKQLELLGAKVVPKFTDEVTHVVWRNGKACTRTKAMKKGVHLVSVLWIESCRQKKEHVAEDLYPVTVDQEVSEIFGVKKRRMKSMQPQTIEEDLKKMEARHDRLWKKKLAAFNAEIAGSPGTPTFNPETYSPIIVSGQVFTPTRIIIPKTPPSMKEKLNQFRENQTSWSASKPVVGESPVSSLTSSQGKKKLLSFSFSDSSDDESLPEMMYESLSKKVNSLQRASKSKRQKVIKGSGTTPERQVLNLVTEDDGEKKEAREEREKDILARLPSSDRSVGKFSNKENNGTVTGGQKVDSITDEVIGHSEVKGKDSMTAVAVDTSSKQVNDDAAPGKKIQRRKTILSADAAVTEPEGDGGVTKQRKGIGTSRRKSQLGVSEQKSQAESVTSNEMTSVDKQTIKSRRRSVNVTSNRLSSVQPRSDDSNHVDSTAGGSTSKPETDVNSVTSTPSQRRSRRSVAFSTGYTVMNENQERKSQAMEDSQAQDRSDDVVRKIPSAGRRKSVSFKMDLTSETVKSDLGQNAMGTPLRSNKQRRKSESALNTHNRESNSVCRDEQKAEEKRMSQQKKKRKLLPLDGPDMLTGEQVICGADENCKTKTAADSKTPHDKITSVGSENNVSVRKKRRAKSLQIDEEVALKKQRTKSLADLKENERKPLIEGALLDITSSQGIVAEIRKSRKSIDEFSLSKKRKASLQKRCSQSLSTDSESGSDRDTKKRRASTKKEKFKNTIVMTSIPHSDQDLIVSVVKKLKKYSIVDSVTENTTHVICGGNRRTLNVLFGMARGCWLVSTEWVLKSLEDGHWVEEEPYELHDYFPAAQICRLEKQALGNSNYKQDIFSSVGLMFIAESTVPAQEKLIELITLCGGKVCSSLRTAKLCIGNARNKDGIPMVSEKWVLDCISQHTILPFTDYYLT
ncbi:microcephalin-like isoform X2 [Ptychodera flava]|uniref:microcephalin-like isoform X2 n=1 Tax=Ptychodera flava TaxID=63121 RepID=UPI00396AACF9